MFLCEVNSEELQLIFLFCFIHISILQHCSCFHAAVSNYSCYVNKTKNDILLLRCVLLQLNPVVATEPLCLR